LKRTGRLKNVRLALSLDEVGRGSRFDLHAVVSGQRWERAILKHKGVGFVQDPAGEGNSDHREFGRAGVRATGKLGVVDEPLRHTAADKPGRLQRRAFARVLKIVWPLVRDY
jgi:hypothetical protein